MFGFEFHFLNFLFCCTYYYQIVTYLFPTTSHMAALFLLWLQHVEEAAVDSVRVWDESWRKRAETHINLTLLPNRGLSCWVMVGMINQGYIYSDVDINIKKHTLTKHVLIQVHKQFWREVLWENQTPLINSVKISSDLDTNYKLLNEPRDLESFYELHLLQKCS